MSFVITETIDETTDDVSSKLLADMESYKYDVTQALLSANPEDSILICKLQTRYRTYCDIITGINNILEEQKTKEGENI